MLVTDNSVFVLFLRSNNDLRFKTLSATDRSELEIGQHVIEVVELRVLELHHLVLQLHDATHGAVQHVPQHAPLLRVHDLVIGVAQLPQDLNVLDVQGGDQLKCRQAILQRNTYTQCNWKKETASNIQIQAT